jgi:hypothetical protein
MPFSNTQCSVRVEIFMAVKIQVKLFWVVMPCNVTQSLHPGDEGGMDF